MDEFQFIISQFEDGRFVSITLHDGKLIANSLPTSEENALSHAHHIANELKVEAKISAQSHHISQLIHDIDQDPANFWRDSLDLELDFLLYSDKQKQVLENLRKTKSGEVISYGELASQVGISNGARFVGNCMANNKMPLLIPCHRVIRSDGRVGQYSGDGGQDRKKRYLRMENSDFFASQ